MRQSIVIILTVVTLGLATNGAGAGSAVKAVGQGTVKTPTGGASNLRPAIPSASYKNKSNKSPSRTEVKDSHDRYAN
jgi:hypothetical protein